MKIVERKDLPSDYIEMMKTESHHEHLIVKEHNGVLHWEARPHTVGWSISKAIQECGGLNNIVPFFNTMGWDKNSEQLRELYRNMGYSLHGYWEVFYWEFNNPKAHQYTPYKLTRYKV